MDWTRLRVCESSNNYHAIDASGHYGAYQFDRNTWASVGGSGYPNQASPGEQDFRALYLYRMRGWQPWQCASKLRLRPDADAASKRAPGPAAVSTNGQPNQETNTAPPWPGKAYGYGDCDPALRQWQLQMNTHGFHFVGTGCYLDKTRAAALTLQHTNGLAPTGVIGPFTWRSAWQITAPPAIEHRRAKIAHRHLRAKTAAAHR